MMVYEMTSLERYERGRRHLDGAKMIGCEVCGSKELDILDFHHLHDKSFNLSGSACRKPLHILDAEIAKCVIVCANDHRRIHAGTIQITEDTDAHHTTGKRCHYAVGFSIHRHHAGY